MTEKEITAFCEEICNSIGYNFSIPVKINKRLTRTLGRVISFSCAGKVTPQIMEFSYRFLETKNEKMIKNVIKHECAHYLVIIETCENHGHDKVFKDMCARIDCPLDKSSAEESPYTDNSFKYLITCNSCKKIVGRYHRASKIVKNSNEYRCKCGGTLTVTQNW